MPGKVKYPTSLHWKCATCRGLHHPLLDPTPLAYCPTQDKTRYLNKVFKFRNIQVKNTANRYRPKEVRHPPKRTTPEWSHTAVAHMADGQPSELGTDRHPAAKCLWGHRECKNCMGHMQSQPHYDKVRNVCGATGSAKTAWATCDLNHIMTRCETSVGPQGVQKLHGPHAISTTL